MYRIGSGFIGTPSVQTSTANHDVISDVPNPDPHKTTTVLYKFSFLNQADCSVKINGGDPIFIPANKGWNTEVYDATITSFVIVESGISYNWAGSY